MTKTSGEWLFVLHGEDRAQSLRAEAAIARQRAAEVESQLSRITEALLADDGQAPATFARKARDLESALARHMDEADQADQALSRLARADTHSLSKTWADLASGAMALDEAARLKARQLVADTFDRIVVYPMGISKADQEDRSAPIDVLLVAKSGGSRWLRVNRRSGAFVGAEDFIGETADPSERPSLD